MPKLGLIGACLVVGVSAGAVLGFSEAAVAASDNTVLRVPRAEVFKLSNGLRVLLQRAPREPIVATLVSYEVGARDDPPGFEGLAHLVEHLSYSESRHLSKFGIASALVAVGAVSWNGTTLPDHTLYHSVVEASHVALPLWLESERMAFTLEYIDQRALEREQSIVQTELLGGSREQWLKVRRTLYPDGHPYSWPEQPAATVAEIDLGSALGHFQRAYRPDNATLVIVGQIDPPRVREHVNRYFGPIVNPRPKLQRRSAPPRVFPGRETLTVEQRIFGRRLFMIWPAPPAASRDRVAFELLYRLVSASRTGSLSSRLIDETRMASDVDFELDWGDLGSTLTISAELNQGILFDQVEEVIEEHLGRLGQVMLEPRELTRLRAAATTDVLSSFEDVLERANLHLTSLRHFDRPFSLTAELANIGAIDATRLLTVSRHYLDPNHRLSARFDEAKVWVPDTGRVSYSVERRP